LAAAQNAPSTVSHISASVAAICQMGVLGSAQIRRIITNGVIGGTKLSATASAESGCGTIAGQTTRGTMLKSVSGLDMLCASLSVLHADPTAASSAAEYSRQGKKYSTTIASR